MKKLLYTVVFTSTLIGGSFLGDHSVLADEMYPDPTITISIGNGLELGTLNPNDEMYPDPTSLPLIK